MAIIVIFLEIFNAIQCGFFGIILGHKMNNGKIGCSVLFGFIIYLLAQSLILCLVFIYGIFDSTVMELFKTATINIDVKAFKTLAIVSSLLYISIIFIMSLLCNVVLAYNIIKFSIFLEILECDLYFTRNIIQIEKFNNV
jgi:hypothetical protein